MKDEYTFSCNRIALLYDMTDWRPDFYIGVSSDLKIRNDWRVDAIRVAEEGAVCFYDPSVLYAVFRDVPNAYGLPSTRMRYRDKKHPKHRQRWPYFAWDCDLEVNIFRSSTFVFAQLAFWMGFNPLYLVGLDGYEPFLHGEKDPNHFIGYYEEQKDPDRCFRDNFHHRTAYEEMLKAAKTRDKEIYDATVDGSCDVFPKVDIWELLSGTKRPKGQV